MDSVPIKDYFSHDTDVEKGWMIWLESLTQVHSQ